MQTASDNDIGDEMAAYESWKDSLRLNHATIFEIDEKFKTVEKSNPDKNPRQIFMELELERLKRVSPGNDDRLYIDIALESWVFYKVTKNEAFGNPDAVQF